MQPEASYKKHYWFVNISKYFSYLLLFFFILLFWLFGFVWTEKYTYGKGYYHDRIQQRSLLDSYWQEFNEVTRKVSSAEGLVQKHLNLVGNHKEKDVPDKLKQDYEKRKLFQEEYDVTSS